MLAKIQWKTREQGGLRNLPPAEGQYAPQVKFLDINEPWPSASGSWSLVVEKVRTEEDEYHWLAEVRFLSPQAPIEDLRTGRAFELYEGGRCIAVGVLKA